MKKLLVFCTLFLAIGSSYSMGKHSGTMSLPANARAICNGIDATSGSAEALMSTLCLIGWHNAISNPGLFSTASLKDPQVTGAIVGGMAGTAVRAIVTDESLKKTSPIIRPLVTAVAKNPFLMAYTGLHAWYRWHEIKQNPWPFVAEASLVALHLYNESN